MKFKICLIISWICVIYWNGKAIAMPQQITHSILKSKSSIGLEYKTYSISDTESIALYGARHKRFITKEWYWGEVGFGAISGKRSGYLEGGLMTGYLQYFNPTTLMNLQLFFGAGGGGSAPQGGGCIINPSIGLGYQINQEFYLTADIGYIKFLNGDIQSMTISVSAHMNYWDLSGE